MGCKSGWIEIYIIEYSDGWEWDDDIYWGGVMDEATGEAAVNKWMNEGVGER